MNTMWIYGDSLSSGTHGEGAYLEYIKSKLQAKKLVNFAVGSSGLTTATPNSMVSIVKDQERTGPEAEVPDLILIWHGSNDWYWGSPLGSMEDMEGDTFAGGMRYVVDTLRKFYPKALIVWATPIFRFEAPAQVKVAASNGFYLANKLGLTLGDYTKAIEQNCLTMSIPVIHMNGEVGIHEYNEAFCLEDHVHPNRQGYLRIERVLEEQLKQLWYFHSGEKL